MAAAAIDSLSPQLPQWALKILAPAVGATLALAAALAAACFVRLRDRLSWAAKNPLAESAREVDPISVAAMGILAALCLLVGIFPEFVIDTLAPAGGLTGAQMPTQAGIPWLSIAPIAESRSSYNGLLVFLFIAASASLAAFAIHQIASKALAGHRLGIAAFPTPIRLRNTPRKVSLSRSGACSAPSHSALMSASTCQRQGKRGPPI